MTDVDMGPNASAVGLQRMDELVKRNLEEGAELLVGGKRPDGKAFEKGHWYEPTILTGVKPGHATLEHEIFGPILPITRVSSYEEAKSLLNDREEGLSAYLWTQNHRTIMHAIQDLQVGTI